MRHSSHSSRPNLSLPFRPVGVLGLFVGAACSISIAAQPQLNPVYVDDSPTALETFARVNDHVAAGNLDEAVRVLQTLLDEQGDRLTPAEGQTDTFIAVRTRVHQVLLENPALLTRYRELQDARAAAALQTELAINPADPLTASAPIERSFLLTPSGMESALRIAQRHFEDGRFEGARLTLEQLDRHPDRTGASPMAQDAAKMLTAIARYLPREEVTERAKRWREQAGITPDAQNPDAPMPWPAGALTRARTPLDTLPPLDTSGIISKPLWTIAIQTTTPNAMEPGLREGGDDATLPPNARELVVLPSIDDDLLLINDGAIISAFDRFTLSPRWSIQPAFMTATASPDPDEREWGMMRRWGGFGNVEPLTSTIWRRSVFAATGRHIGAGRDGDDRIHALDVQTGRLRWTTSLGQIDADLADCGIRGPLEVDERVVVAAVRKHAPDRRLLSLTLVGIDAGSGQRLWQRPIGSAGWLPFGNQSFGPEGSTIHEGVVYRSDRLGVAAAVELVSGRPVWIRRLATEATGTSAEQPQAWQISRPIADGSSIVMLTPDLKKVERIDARTGSTLASRPSVQFSSSAPAYILKAGGSLAVVGGSRIGLAPLATFEKAEIRLTPTFEGPGIRGRVSAVGDRLLVPITRGLAIVDPAKAGDPPPVFALDEPGNVLALDGQLVVVDDTRAHSYLEWAAAESILSARMKADPQDPTPAVTFAELAYRALKPDRIVQPLDAAIAAIKTEPDSERNRSARRRLFDSVHAMINSGLEPAPADPIAVSPERLSRPSLAAPRIEDRTLLTSLIDRLGQVAVEPDDRVAVSLASGRLAEIQSDPAKASDYYQTVLDEPAMAVANWRSAAVSVRAELEAARRLEQLIAQHGPAVYAKQEAACRQRLADLGASATPEQLELLAARYPLASPVPSLYLRLSDLHKKADRTRNAITALESGLKSAQRIASPDPIAIGELGGRLVDEFRTQQQPAAAANVLRTLKRRFPAAILTLNGVQVDTQLWEAELTLRIAAGTRWPRVGSPSPDNLQVLQGWSLLRPRLPESTPHSSGALVMEADRQIAVFAPAKDKPELTNIWNRRIDPYGGDLIRVTSDAAYILARASKTTVVEKVALPGSNGKSWTSRSLAELFPPGDDTRGLQRAPGVMADAFEVPDEGFVSGDDLLAVIDDRTLVLIQRAGRAVGIDCDSGDVLWSTGTSITAVNDAHLEGDTLAIAGDVRKADPTGAGLDLTPSVQLIDARSGRLGQRLADFTSRLRWIRLTDAGQLVAACETEILGIDLSTFQRNWTIADANLAPAVAGWVFGDRLLLMSVDRQLWMASLSNGRVNQRPLDAPRTHMEITRDVEVFATTANPDGPIGVSTYQGLLVFSGAGELQGIDGLGGLDTMLPPRPASDRAVTIQTTSDIRVEMDPAPAKPVLPAGPRLGLQAQAMMQYNVLSFETTGAALADSRPILLGTRPHIMEVMDNRIAITAGGLTLIIHAPANP